MDFIDQGVAKMHVFRGILGEIVRILSPAGEVLPERPIASRLLARGAAEACARLAARFAYVGGMTSVEGLLTILSAEWDGVEESFAALSPEDLHHARALGQIMVANGSGAESIRVAMSVVDRLVRQHRFGKAGSFDG